MKAFQVARYKGPLEPAEVAEPPVGADDVMVDIKAAGVNHLDMRLQKGELKLVVPYKTPFTPGHDLAGVVTETGANVTRFVVGDEVYGRPRDGRIGTFAERLAVHEADLARKPGRLTMIEAASAPLVGLTAWQALIDVARVQPGQKVLIHAGSGGVGTFAIQLAKHLGAHVATTTSASNAEWVARLGADLVIDYRSESFDKILSGYDVVLDTQGGETLARSLQVLKPGGIAVGIASPPDPAFARRQGLGLPLRLAMAGLSWKVRRLARRLGVRYSFLFMSANGEQLGEITKLFENETVRPVVDRSYPFDRTPEALAYLAAGRSKGKVVISQENSREA